jgi:hypothetical protein
LYSNGFEANTNDWSAGVTRVPSGTAGVTSADGSFHGVAASGSFSRWGGYNFGAASSPFQEYWTSVDIYLNVGSGLANDTRFDFTSAINNLAGAHRRDFAFNAGFYNDATGPGSGSDRFVFSASNNTGRGNSDPKNPARSPIAISSTGWYTFEHHFYDNAGVLAVDLSIFDTANSLLGSWTLSDLTDVIGGPNVGGNRYGWFSSIEASPTGGSGSLPIDNASLRINGVVPEPHTIAVWAVLGLCGSAIAWLTRRRAEA